jgi:hypothetical protein
MSSIHGIKEELILSYTRAIACRAGFVLEGVQRGPDGVVAATVRSPEPLSSTATLASPALDLHLATQVLDPLPEKDILFDLPAHGYERLIARCAIPRVLVVFVMARDEKSWLGWTENQLVLPSSAYWISLLGRVRVPNAGAVRIAIPRTQLLEPFSLRTLLQRVGEEEDLA